MNRKLNIMILTVLVALTVTACACSGGSTKATPSPKPPAVTATPLPSPEFSPAAPETSPDMTPDTVPEMTPGDTTDPTSPDATEGPTMMGIDVSKLILELEKLSEVQTAAVVAQGGRALVGLNFDAQYQGTLTERIEEMVVSAVSSVESMLTDVAVTADPTLVEQIRTLSTAAEGQTLTAEQQTQFDELYQKIKPGKSTEPEIK